MSRGLIRAANKRVILSAHLYRRENKLAEAEQQFRDMLASNPQDPQVIYFCHFELARILDRTERFDEAMAELERRKGLSRKNINIAAAQKYFDDRRERVIRKTRSLPKNISNIWGKSFPPQARTCASPLAFLGGHARSGTTLLERILDAHPVGRRLRRGVGVPNHLAIDRYHRAGNPRGRASIFYGSVT